MTNSTTNTVLPDLQRKKDANCVAVDTMSIDEWIDRWESLDPRDYATIELVEFTG